MRKKMKLKTKKKKLKKVILLFSFIFFIGAFSFSLKKQISNIKLESSKYTEAILYEGNHNLPFPYEIKNVWDDMISFLLNVSIKDPNSIISSIGEDETFSINSNYIEDPSPKSNKEDPLIYIYNTHQLEEYNKSNDKEYSVIPNVLMASYMLREKLNNKNLPSLVETSDIAELLRINNYQYYRSYDITRDLILSVRENYSSLKYYIDLHRDSISYDLTTLDYDNKKFAKVLFIVGLENNNYQGNLDLMNNICNEMNKDISNICKGIYKKQGEGVNGIYNQDIDPNVILIEVGGVDNTIEEVNNTLDAFSNVLERIITYEK